MQFARFKIVFTDGGEWISGFLPLADVRREIALFEQFAPLHGGAVSHIEELPA